MVALPFFWHSGIAIYLESIEAYRWCRENSRYDPDRESFQRLDRFPVIADCVLVSQMLSKGGARRSVLNNLAQMGMA